MRIEFILSTVFFLVGLIVIVYSIVISDAMVLAQSSLLLFGALFIEMLIMKEEIKELKEAGKKNE